VNDFEMVQVAPIFTGITFFFTLPSAIAIFYCKEFTIIIIISSSSIIGSTNNNIKRSVSFSFTFSSSSSSSSSNI